MTTTITRKWVLKGSKPRVGSPPQQSKVSYSGFVLPDSGKLITHKTERFNFETVIESFRKFLAQVQIPEGKKVGLFLDNAPWHKKAFRLVETEKRPEFADIRNKLELIMLPTYSPDLNPIEQCWRITRREITHNRFFKTIEELENQLDSYFAEFNVPNEKLRKLCSFNHKNL